ncbi:MAG: hypothetical protein ABIA92_02315 [Patescibacteria group bacterium]
MTYVVCDARSGAVAAQGSFNFVEHLGSKYNLKDGGYLDQGEGVIRIPYGLLPDALDLTFADVVKKLGNDRYQLARIVVSLQQHGMGAWLPHMGEGLYELGRNPKRPLSAGFQDLFATNEATSWQDTASRQDCEEFERAIPADRWAELTGSSPMQSLRFMGAQIARLGRVHQEDFQRTNQFTVLASIVASILVGKPVGIGLDEASCTLLMNLKRGVWSKTLLRSDCFPEGTSGRLPRILPPGARLGNLWRYHVVGHELPAACQVSMGFGDNIAIMLTMANEPGQFGLSMGTSGTTYSEMDKATYDPTHACHVLRSGTGKFMGMYCAANCGKFADAVRELAYLSWEQFDALVANAQWDDPGAMILPTSDEAGLRLFNLKDGDRRSAYAVTRSIIADMWHHSRFMGDPDSIVVTGGFATEPVAQVVADMFQAKVFVSPKMNRVAMGSVVLGVSQVLGEPIPEVAARLCPKGKEIAPYPARAKFYEQFLANYARNLRSI